MTENGTQQPAARRTAGLLPVVALAALAALLLATGFFAWKVLEERRADAARQDGLLAARDAAVLLFSYNYETLQEDFEAALEVTTGDFTDEYRRTTKEVVEPVAQEYDAAVEAVVVEAGVVEAEADRVVALVFLNQTTTSTRVDGPKVDQSRVRLSLTKVDGEWRVDRVDAL